MRHRWPAVVAVIAAVAFGACGAGHGRAPAADDIGPVKWRWHAPRPASVGMPAADDVGAAATYGHTSLVLFGPDGVVRWEAHRLGVREEASLLTPELVVVPADDGVVAVERATGRTRWDTRLGDTASTPVLAGRLVLTCVSGGALVAVDVDTGAVAWRVTLPARAEGPPATDGRTAVATWDPDQGEHAGLTAVDVATGRERWTAQLRGGGVSGPGLVHADGSRAMVVAVDDDLAAKAFELSSGRALWRAGLGGAGSPELPPVAMGGGGVLVADRLAGLTLLDGAGHRVWSSPPAGAATRGGLVGPALGGRYVLPLYSGRVLLAGPGRRKQTFEPPGGLANGVALAPGGLVLVSTAQGRDNQLVAYGPG
jgi:outer membrane protein assembly factor BamB